MIMSRLIRTSRILGLSIFQTWDPDFVEEPKALDDGTAFGRLKNVFERDSDGNYHAAVCNVINSTALGVTLGGVYGGITTSRFTFLEFLDANEATQFRDHREAKRILSDKMMLSFYRGFVKYGLKIGFFIFIFQGCGSLISAVRLKDSVFDYTIGGMCAGAIYKFNLGPKGMFAGGVIGLFFGTVYGIFNVGFSLLQRLTGAHVKEFQKELYSKRAEAIRKAEKEHVSKMEQEALADLTKIYWK